MVSHVSEFALSNAKQVRLLLTEFESEVDIDTTSLSELTAYCIVRSSAFRELIALCGQKFPQYCLPADPIEKIAGAIIGQRISEDVPLLNELISGPFDADKLDYMPRDAYMCGVPAVTDIPRLIQKVRAVSVEGKHLPFELKQQLYDKEGRPAYTITGIAFSGARTIDELLLGRIFLFDKLYRHQKVRAVQSMVAAIFDNVRDFIAPIPSMAPYQMTDAELFHLTEHALAGMAGRGLTEEERKRARVACDLSTRLRERRLFVRAFAFGQNMPTDPYKADPDHWNGLLRAMADVKNPVRRNEFASKVVAELKRLLDVLREEGDVHEEFVEADVLEHVESYVRVDSPQGAPAPDDHPYLVTDNRVIRFKVEYAETMGWTEAYLTTRDISYVFTVEELAPYVFLAAEKMLRSEYGARVPKSMLSAARQSPDDIEGLKRRLVSLGYYEKDHGDLLPVPLRLQRLDAADVIDGVVMRLQGYEGPVRLGQPLGKLSLNQRDRVVDWLKQFDNDDDINSALEMVQKVRLVGRREVVVSLRNMFETDEGRRLLPGSVCPFGEPKDSSSIVTYYVSDLAEDFDLRTHLLHDALLLDRPLIFADDIIGSGRQSVTIVESWLGIDPTYDLHEERREPLSGDLLDRLREREMLFVYACGSPEGKALFQDRLNALGLNATVHVGITDLPQAFPPVAGEDDVTARFRERCAEIGREVLLSQGRPLEWVEGRKLGYGNEAFLVIFPYNTPAQTITCLWAEGVVEGRPWLALYRRRKKA